MSAPLELVDAGTAVHFRDLGPLRVEVADRTVSVNGRLAAVLEALLLHRGQRVSLDLLLDAVWAEGITSRSASTLETHVWRLRQLLEPGRGRGQARLLVNDQGGYRLLAGAGQVDSAVFERSNLDVLDLISTEQSARALESADTALDLWRGEPFGAVAERLWAVGPVAALAETRAQLRERRIDALLGLGRSDAAVVELETLVVEHPYRERLWWQRMLALHRLGRTDEALRSFRLLRGQLLDELGLEPGPELIELERRILNQDTDLTPSVPVPVRPRRPVEIRLPRRRALVGRTTELAGLRDDLRRNRLVTIVGAAGTGKTALAVEGAREVADEFPDGVVFVDLSTTELGSDPAVVVAATLEVTVPEGVSAAESLLHFGADRCALLVLDNCEQLLDAVADLAERLLEGCPQLTLLVTSREPLDLGDEQVQVLRPLDVGGDRRGTQPDLHEEPALALFASRARLPGELSGDDVADARLICRAVDGIPLAIELAAALTGTYTLAEIAEQVVRDPGQLAAVGRGQAHHHQTLATAIERSYRLLAGDERMLYRRLAVVPGSFGRDLAEAVVEPEHRPQVPGQLAGLTHRSVLTSSRVDGRTRFTQLAPIRGHARHALRAEGDLERAEALRDSWVEAIVTEKPRAGAPAEGAWHATLIAELPTLRAALRRRRDLSRDANGSTVIAMLTGFWFYADLLEEGTRWTEITHRQVGQSGGGDSEPSRILTGLSLAALLAMRTRADRAGSLLLETLTRIEADQEHGLTTRSGQPLLAGNPIVPAEMLLAMATSFSTLRDPDLMRPSLDLLTRTRWLEDDPHLAVIHDAARCLIRVIEGDVSVLADAERVYGRAMGLGNSYASWIASSCGSSLALNRADPDLGLHWSRRVIEGQERLGARAVLPQLETFGDFLAMQGRAAEAVRLFAATRHQARRAGNPWPRNPATAELLARCRSMLGEQAFTRAWAIGPTLSRAQLLDESPLAVS